MIEALTAVQNQADSYMQKGLGLIQTISAKKIRDKALKDFEYEIPDATREQVRMSRELAMQRGLPGEDIARARVQSGAAQAIAKGASAAGTSSDVLSLLSNIWGNTVNFERDMQEKGAQFYTQNQDRLISTLGLLANAENERFYYNKYVPFMSQMGMAGQMAAGGAANIAGGGQTQQATMGNLALLGGEKDAYREFRSMFGIGEETKAPSTILPDYISPPANTPGQNYWG